MKGKPSLLWLIVLLGLQPLRAENLDCHAIHAPLRAISTTSSATAIGPQRALWYRLSFAEDTRAPFDGSAVNTLMASADATLQRISFGNTSLTWDITPLLQLPRSAAFYSANLIALLDDARALAAAKGFQFTDYDRDVFAPPRVPDWPAGRTFIGSRWIYIGHPSSALIVHELGHSFGLLHADAWDNARPDPFQLTSPPFPSNIHDLSESFAFETNSFVGRADIMQPGLPIQYGDPFDIMAVGGTNSDFHVTAKQRLGWLPATATRKIGTNGTYRIHTQAASRLNSNHPAALQIDRPVAGRHLDGAPRYYVLELSPQSADAITLRWIDITHQNPTLLVEATPTAWNGVRHPLQLGRSFTDPALGIIITPITVGGEGDERWIDVSVEFGATPRPISNPPIPPDLLSIYKISGRVTDTSGRPLPNSRVHNGRINLFPHDRADFFSTETDLEGNYTLWVDDRILPHCVGASVYGYRAANGSTEQVVTIPESGSVSNINFTFEPLPRVSISAPPIAFHRERAAFTISRTGPVTLSLEVWWQVTGSADEFDYDGPFGAGRVTIPAGQTSTTIPITPHAGNGSVTLHAVPPRSITANGITTSYPGWELRPTASGARWFQTDPAYATYADSSATITFAEENASPTLQLAVGPNASLNIKAATGQNVLIETSTDLQKWRPLSTLLIQTSPTSVPIPSSTDTQPRFYRVKLLP